MKTLAHLFLSIVAGLIVPGCSTPSEITEKKMRPMYNALYADYQNRRIDAQAFAARKRELDQQFTNTYSAAVARQERNRQAGLAIAAGLNAASQSMSASSYNPYVYGATPAAHYVRSSPVVTPAVLNSNRYHPDSLANPYGAGSPYKADGLMNPYSQYGSPYSSKSWTNPYATNAPKLYDANGRYLGRLSTNPYAPDSTSNPYGRYGSKYSPTSINNPYGAGNPYSSKPIYVQPQ